MKALSCVELTLVVVAALALGLAASPLSGQEPPPSPEPEAAEPQEAPEEQEQAEKEEEAKEEEFKEEEPATAADKLEKEEIEKRACPAKDVKFKTETDKKTHPTPDPPSDKALVYVVRPTMSGNKIQSKLAVDGSWVGVNRGHNYFFLTLDPGRHYFCSKAENKSVLALELEAGKAYYVEQKIKMGFMKARNKLALLSEEEGKKKLAKCHPSSWQEKK